MCLPMKINAFWNVAVCRMVEINKHFEDLAASNFIVS